MSLLDKFFGKRYSSETEEKAKNLGQTLKRDRFYEVWSKEPYDGEVVACLQSKLKDKVKNNSDAKYVSENLTKYQQMQSVHEVLQTEGGYKDDRFVNYYADEPNAFLALTQKPTLENAQVMLAVGMKIQSTDKTAWSDTTLLKNAAYAFAELGKVDECQRALQKYKKLRIHSSASMREFVVDWFKSRENDKPGLQAAATMGAAALRTDLQAAHEMYDAARYAVDVLKAVDRNNEAATITVLSILAEDLRKKDPKTVAMFVNYTAETELANSKNNERKEDFTEGQKAAFDLLVAEEGADILSPKAAQYYDGEKKWEKTVASFYQHSLAHIQGGTQAVLDILAPDMTAVDKFLSGYNAYKLEANNDRQQTKIDDLIQGSGKRAVRTTMRLARILYNERIESKPLDELETQRNLKIEGVLINDVLNDHGATAEQKDIMSQFAREMILTENAHKLPQTSDEMENTSLALLKENAEDILPKADEGYIWQAVNQLRDGETKEKLLSDVKVQWKALQENPQAPNPGWCINKMKF